MSTWPDYCCCCMQLQEADPPPPYTLLHNIHLMTAITIVIVISSIIDLDTEIKQQIITHDNEKLSYDWLKHRHMTC
jgi:hypothetical protein